MSRRERLIAGLCATIALLSCALAATIVYRVRLHAAPQQSAAEPPAPPTTSALEPSTVAPPIEPDPSAYGPVAGQSPRAFVRAEIQAQIADGRSMADVRRRAFAGGRDIDFAAIDEKVARQNAHFATNALLLAWLRETGIPASRAAEEAMFERVSAEHEEEMTDDEVLALYDDPRVLPLSGAAAWLFQSFAAIEHARLCGDGEDQAHAEAHCADAERALRELDVEIAAEYGPLTD